MRAGEVLVGGRDVALDERRAEVVRPGQFDAVVVGHVAAGGLPGEESPAAPADGAGGRPAAEPVQDVPDVDGVLDHEVARALAAAEPAVVPQKRAVAAGPRPAGLDQRPERSGADQGDALAEPRVRPPLEPDVDDRAGRALRLGDQPVAALDRDGHRLLGVQVLAGLEDLRGDPLVKVARDGHDDRVDVGALQNPPGVRKRRRPPPGRLLDDPLAAAAMAGLRIGDDGDADAGYLQKRAEQGRPSIADADDADAQRVGRGRGVGSPLAQRQTGAGGRIAEEPAAVKGDRRHGRGPPVGSRRIERRLPYCTRLPPRVRPLSELRVNRVGRRTSRAPSRRRR